MPLISPYNDARTVRSWRRYFVCAAMMAVVAGGLWAWPRVDFWRESRFAAGLAGYAETAPDGPAVMAVRQVHECGLAGVDALVRLAGSPRPAVAAAAQDAVLDETAAWETSYRAYGDGRLLGRRLVVLARAVDRWANEFDPAARRWADRLTLEIIDASGAVPAEQSMELLALGDGLLAQSPTLGAPRPRLPDLPPAIAQTEMIAETEPIAPISRVDSLESPVAQALPQAMGTASDLAVVAEDMAAQPRRVVGSDGGVERLPPAPGAKPQAMAVAPVGTPVPEVKPRPLPVRAPSADVVDVPSPQRVRANMRQWRQASDAELSMRLRSAPPYDALAIATVLCARGVASTNLAGWKADLPTKAGGGVFDALSTLPPASVRERLRQLVSHADPEVRLQALTMLATSGDPQLDEIVRRRAVEDIDPRVAELATRIMRGEMR